ncbi:hypothetical protein ACFP1C_05525 [Levilactobacillus fujinensis]|uniref:Uncharacterized protein n=1 Tax=Levilactobacillus fujinensis TaxID=2486024 RepID=A0ABW1TEN3_9LACO
MTVGIVTAKLMVLVALRLLEISLAVGEYLQPKDRFPVRLKAGRTLTNIVDMAGRHCLILVFVSL